MLVFTQIENKSRTNDARFYKPVHADFIDSHPAEKTASEMIEPTPSSLPQTHQQFLSRALAVFKTDVRIAGIAAGGSYLTNTMDQFSDLDILVVTQTENHAEVMADRPRIARALGPLLEAFTGEHVGEPRLLICLYGPSMLHVDLKFVTAKDLGQRVEEPLVLWERDGQLTRALGEGAANYPAPKRQWIEDRFWIWLHYGAGKIGRGEIFEAIEFISYLRVNVLGPMGLQMAGALPNGVRKIEKLAPTFSKTLTQTVPTYDAKDCARALRVCADIYKSLRSSDPSVNVNQAAEAAAMQYLSDIESALSEAPTS